MSEQRLTRKQRRQRQNLKPEENPNPRLNFKLKNVEPLTENQKVHSPKLKS
jgi:hypothetical protein